MLRAAEQHQRQQALLAAAVERQSLSIWKRVTPSSIASSWSVLVSAVLQVISAGQLLSAQRAAPYVQDALDEQNLSLTPVATVVPAAFSGIGGDGRSIQEMLDWPVTGKDGVLDRIGQGQGTQQALDQAGRRIALIAGTQVQDAGRNAVSAEITARPKVGFVRALNPPSCARCVILAGRWYRYNADFLRHPGDDCVAIPAMEADSPLYETDPKEYVYLLSSTEQDKLLTKAGAQAFRDGADLSQIVNSRSGMSANGVTTTTGTTRRGLAGQRLQGRQRLTVKAIYDLASDREEAVQLLKRNGFIR